MDRINNIIEAGELEIQFKFIDFAMKMIDIEYRAIKLDPYLSFSEKNELCKIYYDKIIKIIDE